MFPEHSMHAAPRITAGAYPSQGVSPNHVPKTLHARNPQERGYAPGDTWLAAEGSGCVQGTFSDGEIGVEFVQGDAESLPFEDGSVDALTIAFGLRNVTRTLPALKEIHRVLKRGGRFMCMEFSKVSSDSALLLDVCWHLSLHALIAYAFTLLCACSIRNMWT